LGPSIWRAAQTGVPENRDPEESARLVGLIVQKPIYQEKTLKRREPTVASSGRTDFKSAG
jgi:hypothetical protein